MLAYHHPPFPTPFAYYQLIQPVLQPFPPLPPSSFRSPPIYTSQELGAQQKAALADLRKKLVEKHAEEIEGFKTRSREMEKELRERDNSIVAGEQRIAELEVDPSLPPLLLSPSAV